MVDERQHAPSALRNRGPIFEVLKAHLPERGMVLEVASGSGTHAAFFAPKLPGITWQPSDQSAEAIRSIAAWREDVGATNLREPIRFDVHTTFWPVDHASAVVCINMLHISPWSATIALFDGASRVLGAGGLLILYGPFLSGDGTDAPSNLQFDANLRSRNAEWGVRMREDVLSLAMGHNFEIVEIVDMPANNQTLVLRRCEAHPIA